MIKHFKWPKKTTQIHIHHLIIFGLLKKGNTQIIRLLKCRQKKVINKHVKKNRKGMRRIVVNGKQK